MKVRDLMTTNVVTLDAQADLDLANGLMSIMRIRHLPVILDQRVVGLVTHRDLLHASLSSIVEVRPEEELELMSAVPVAKIMRRDVQTVAPDLDVRAAIELMRTRRYGCLPVVDEEGLLVGIVTEADFLHLTQVMLERVECFNVESLRTLAGQLKAEVEG